MLSYVANPREDLARRNDSTMLKTAAPPQEIIRCSACPRLLFFNLLGSMLIPVLFVRFGFVEVFVSFGAAAFIEVFASLAAAAVPVLFEEVLVALDATDTSVILDFVRLR